MLHLYCLNFNLHYDFFNKGLFYLIIIDVAQYLSGYIIHEALFLNSRYICFIILKNCFKFMIDQIISYEMA